MTDQKISRKNTFFEDNDEGDKRTDSVSRNYSKPRAGTKGLFLCKKQHSDQPQQ